MKISWKYAKVLLQFQNGVGPGDSSNIMLRSQKKCSCCMLRISYTRWSEVWKQVFCNCFKYKNAKKIDGAPDWHIDSYGGTSEPSTSDVGIKSVPREKKLIMTLTHSVWHWQAHDFAAYDICPPGQGAFWQVAKNKFCHLHIADWLPLSWDDLRSETCLFVKKSAFRYKDIFPQRTSTWFLWLLVLELYYSYSCGSCFYYGRNLNLTWKGIW